MKILARFLLTSVLSASVATVPPTLGQTTAQPAEPEAPPTIERMIPGYSLADEARDPFFAVDNQFPQRPQAILPKDPTAADLLPLVKVLGLMGRAEDPKSAGILMSDKIYRIGSSIPVASGGKTYEFTLVGVVFPDKVMLAYKDETVTLTIGK